MQEKYKTNPPKMKKKKKRERERERTNILCRNEKEREITFFCGNEK